MLVEACTIGAATGHADEGDETYMQALAKWPTETIPSTHKEIMIKNQKPLINK